MKHLLRGMLLFLLLVMWPVWAQTDLLVSREGRATVFNALVDVFKKNYWQADYLDWDSWAQRYQEAALDAPSRESFDRVVRRMVADLNDQHSNYLGLVSHVDDADDLAKEPPQLGLGFDEQYLSGAGIVLRRVYPQTPAAKAGLRRGDLIVRVNGRDVRDLDNNFLGSSILAGALESGEIRLDLRRGSRYLSASLTPTSFVLDEVKTLPQAEMLDSSTAYLYIPTFNVSGVADKVHRLLAELQAQGAKSLILDLRGNLGGRIDELGLVLGSFIDGPWVQAISRGEVAWRSSYRVTAGVAVNAVASLDGDYVSRLELRVEPVRFDGPLVVLVDKESSSAGEIAPLVLRQLKLATVIGESTQGNVEAVRGFDLPDGSLVLVAVANLQAISGASFNNGIIPDIAAKSDLRALARGFDAPLAEALRLLKDLPFTPGRFF